MDAHYLDTMAKADSAKNGQGKKGQKRAFLGYPGVSRNLACESFSTNAQNGDYSNENNSQPVDKNDAFLSVTGALKIAEKYAEQELKQQKLLAAQIKEHLSKAEVRDKIVAFMRYHDDVPNAQITACLMAMIRQYAPCKDASAKDIAGLAASSVDGLAEWFARDKAFPLLVSIGLVDARENARGYVWADLAAKRKAQRDAVIQLVKSVARPGFPELAEEQRKYAAALKANEIAKKRAEVARQTNAIIANTDQTAVLQRDSNTKVILAAVAAALFAGGVLVAKYGSHGDASPAQQENSSEYENAPVYDVEKMLSESNPDFYKLPMDEQARLIGEAKAAFAK